jgi:hypothetical protein
LTEHQRQRHGQTVIDVHPVDDREIEILLDHGLRDVRRKLRAALDGRHGARPPALVRDRNSAAQPIANVGTMSRLKAVA